MDTTVRHPVHALNTVNLAHLHNPVHPRRLPTSTDCPPPQTLLLHNETHPDSSIHSRSPG